MFGGPHFGGGKFYLKAFASAKTGMENECHLGLCRAENFPARAGPGQKNSPKNRPGPGRAKTCFSKNRPGPKRAEKIMAWAKKGQIFFGEYMSKRAQKIEKLTNVKDSY